MPNESPEQAIAAQAAALDRALVDGDPAGVAAFFTVDGVLGESGLEDVVGRATIAGFLAKANTVRRVTAHRLVRDEIEILGDKAIEWARFDETKMVPGKLPILERGRVVVTWRREHDGVWRIARLVISDLPVT